MNEKDTGTVRFTLDPMNPPTMTPEEEARFDGLRDEDIDFSDIPPQAGKTGWVRGGLKERIAQRIADNKAKAPELAVNTEDTVRLQADVLSFFKESGDASEERINAVLREYVKTHKKSA